MKRQLAVVLCAGSVLASGFSGEARAQKAAPAGLGDIDPAIAAYRDAIATPSGEGPAAIVTGQTVLLEFDLGVDGNIDYTPAIRDAIEARMAADYAAFGVNFTQNVPASGPFSVVFFNAGGPGGLAEAIDFRNLNQSDSAIVNVTGIATGSTQSIIDASANIGSHELGHLFGLRHGDAFGPIGSGISATGPGVAAYLPAYPGPTSAVETPNSLMASPSSVGVGIETGDAWLVERSAVKLAFANDGSVVDETPGAKDSLASAQPIELAPLLVPNTVESGLNAGAPDLSFDAVTVLGSRSPNQDDLYEFEASAGDLLNIEVMSTALTRNASPFDTTVTVLDAAGFTIPYYSGVAFNDDEFESFDSILIDLPILEDGTYYVRVGAFSSGSSGDYELFVHRFNGAIPEPATLLLVITGIAVGHWRRG